jgi:hypothetical protein
MTKVFSARVSISPFSDSMFLVTLRQKSILTWCTQRTAVHCLCQVGVHGSAHPDGSCIVAEYMKLVGIEIVAFWSAH